MASSKQDFEAVIKLVAKLNEELVKTGEIASKAFITLGDNKTLKGLKDAEKAIDNLNKSTEELKKNKKEEDKLNKQLKNSTDEEVKGKIRLQKANKAQKDILKDLTILQDKQAGTLEKLTAKNRQLRREREQLNLKTIEGQKRLKEINIELDKNNKFIIDSADALKKQKLNIGNYKSALDGLSDSFEDQKKKLKILTDTYKDSVSQGKKNSKEAKELRKELDKQKESLEDVEKATKEASKASEKFGTATKALGIGAVLAILAKLGDLFGESREATIEADKKMAVFTETIKTFFSTLVNSWGGFKIILVALGESAKSFFISFEIGVVNLQLSLAKLDEKISILPDSVKKAKDNVALLTDKLKTLNEEQSALNDSSNTLADGYTKIVEAFKGSGETTEKAIGFQQKYLELQLQTKIEIEKQTRALGGLAEMRQILQDISDDDTLGFETRAEAVRKSQEIAVEFAEKEISLAKLKEELTIQDIKGQLLRANVINDAGLTAIKTGEQLNDLLKDRQIALKISDSSESAFTEAFVERKDREVEAQSFARDQEEKNRKTFRDSYEQRLDIIEEFAELQFTKNEELLNNDKKSQEDRADVFIKNQKLSNDLFNKGIELTIEQGKKSIDINKLLTDSEKDIAKAKLDNADFGAILNAQSEEERFELIRRLDLGEIEEKRLKETFKIRFEQNNSLITQQDALNESNRGAQELQKEIALQEEALAGTTQDKLDDLAINRNEAEKENLTERIDLLEEDSIERLNLEKEYNDLLLDEKKTAIEEQNELDEEQAKKQKELTDATLSFIEESTKKASDKKASDKKIKALDDELSASKEQQSKLQDLANKGSEDAVKSIALAQQREAELRREKEKEIQKQKLIEAGLTAFKVFSAKTEQGDKNALGNTITDLTTLQAFITGLSGFYEGTENVAESLGAPQLAGKDGHIIRVDGSERVIAGKDNKKMGGISNEKASSIIEMYNKGLLSEQLPQYEIKQQPYQSNEELLNEVKELQNVMKTLHKRMPQSSLGFDSFRGKFELKSKKGNNTTNYLFD
jgi:hypothetical protein